MSTISYHVDGGAVNEVASAYLEAGYAVVPVPPRSKAPNLPGWQARTFTPDDFTDEGNIGIKPGEPSGGLCDVDLDCSEALTLADRWLPSTGMESGRESTSRSHRWYKVTGRIPETRQYKDANGDSLVELRSTGGHTLVPPSVYPIDEDHPEHEACVWHRDGEPATVAADELEWAAGLLAVAALLARHWPGNGSRHDVALAVAGTLLEGGVSQEDVTHLIECAATRAGDGELQDRLRCVDTTAAALAEHEPVKGSRHLRELLGDGVVTRVITWLGLQRRATANEAGLDDSTLTDMGNAALLAREYGHRLRYVPQWGWLVYENGVWKRGADGDAMECAKNCIRQAWRDAIEMNERRMRDATAHHYQQSMNATRLRAMLDLARSEPGIVARVEDFDRDTMRFNVLNGTLDLRTGELCEHNPDDLLTQQAPVIYDPDATAPRWEQFLRDVFQGDAELVAYVQRALGYCLTGETREQVYFNPYGSGGNGKSTLLGAVAYVLGDYAGPLTADALMARSFHRGAGPEPELVALVGKRLVIAQEPKEGGKLDTARVKSLTGGDALQVRDNYKPPFTFTPQFKLWLSTNGRPEVGETSEGIWRRVRSIPFTARFASRPQDGQLQADGTLADALRAEAPGILNWLIAGALAWHRDGLGTCPAVDEATRAYREDEDEYIGFFSEVLVPERHGRVLMADAYAAYEQWRLRTSGPFLNRNKAFPHQAEQHGYTRATGAHQVRYLTGCRLCE